MKEWLIVIAVIAVVFVIFFVVLRSPASAQDSTKTAGSWLNGVLQTKSSGGSIRTAQTDAADLTGTHDYLFT